MIEANLTVDKSESKYIESLVSAEFQIIRDQTVGSGYPDNRLYKYYHLRISEEEYTLLSLKFGDNIWLR